MNNMDSLLYIFNNKSTTLLSQEVCCIICEQTFIFTGWWNGWACRSYLSVSERSTWDYKNAVFIWNTSWNHNRWACIFVYLLDELIYTKFTPQIKIVDQCLFLATCWCLWYYTGVVSLDQFIACGMSREKAHDLASKIWLAVIENLEESEKTFLLLKRLALEGDVSCLLNISFTL